MEIYKPIQQSQNILLHFLKAIMHTAFNKFSMHRNNRSKIPHRHKYNIEKCIYSVLKNHFLSEIFIKDYAFVLDHKLIDITTIMRNPKCSVIIIIIITNETWVSFKLI